MQLQGPPIAAPCRARGKPVSRANRPDTPSAHRRGTGLTCGHTLTHTPTAADSPDAYNMRDSPKWGGRSDGGCL